MANTQADTAGVEWTEESVHIDGCTIFFYHTTPVHPLPKVVFLHGGGGNGPMNIPLFSPLSSDFQIFLPSARGFGKSKVDGSPKPTNTMVMVNDAVAFIKHISPDEPVFLIGHSMGATVAPRVAKIYPELVRALVLEDPAWLVKDGEPMPKEPVVMNFGGPPPGEKPKYPFQEEHEGTGGPGSGGRGQDQGRGALSPRGFFGGRGPPPHGFHGGRGPPPGGRGPPFGDWSPPYGVRGPPPVRGGPPQGGQGGQRPGGGDEISNQGVEGINVPTLIFTGGSEGHCNRKVLEATLPTYNRGEEYNFPNAGHDIHSWFPDEWREQVKKFFTSV